MEITEVKINKDVKITGRLKGIAEIVIDGEFIIHDIRIIEGEKRIFLAMPSRKTSTGKFKDKCHPITQECRQKIENAVLKEFNKYA